MSCNTTGTGNSTRGQGTAGVGAIMAELDDRQDQLRQQLQGEKTAEDNGNGNDCDSCSRSRFDDAATAGDDDDDDGSSFGSGGTGSEAADEDGGLGAGDDLDVGRMTLAGGDQHVTQQLAATTVAAAASALAAITLTDTANAAAGEAKTKIEADAEAGDDEDEDDEVEAPPAAISEAGTATIATGSKVILRQGKHELAMPVEVLGYICKFLQYGERAAGGTRSIAGVVSKSLDSNDEKAFWRSFLHCNFSALETAYVLCRGRRTRERGMDILGNWEKYNEELVAEYFDVPIAEALEFTHPVVIFRCPRKAISMDNPAFLLRTIRQGPLDVCGDDPFLRVENGSVTHDFGVCNLIYVALYFESPNCLSALLDLAKADRPTLTYPDGTRLLCTATAMFFYKSTPMPSFELQLLDLFLRHEVCDVNVLDGGYTALHIVLMELWRLGPNESQNRLSRCLATIAVLVKAGADIDREGGVNPITPQEMAIRMTESDDEAVVARGVLALEALNGRLLVNEDVSGIIAKSNALAGVLSFL